MRETEDCFDLANFFDEDNQDQIKVYKVLFCPSYLHSFVDTQLKQIPVFIMMISKFYLETVAVDGQQNSVESL